MPECEWCPPACNIICKCVCHAIEEDLYPPYEDE